MNALATLVVIAKEPRPGAVKTRLTARVTTAAAAAVAQAALEDTFGQLAGIAADRRVLLLQGSPGSWLPHGWDVVPQTDGALDHRIATGLAKLDRGPALLVGMDTPQLGPGLRTTDLMTYDACLGLAEDGGFWALGLADPSRAPEVVEGVPMSTSRTGGIQLARLESAGLRVQSLPVLRDVDTPEDADAVAALVPASRFARVWHEVTA